MCHSQSDSTQLVPVVGSLDSNSQTIIFSLLTYWQDAGRELNGG